MGRKKIYTEEELRIKRNERRMEYYWANRLDELEKSKKRYHNNKSADEVEDPTKPTKRVTTWGSNNVEEVEEVYFEAFDDDTSGNYEGTII